MKLLGDIGLVICALILAIYDAVRNAPIEPNDDEQ